MPAWLPPVCETLTVCVTTRCSAPPVTRSPARYMSRSDTASRPAEVPGCLMQLRDSLHSAQLYVGTVRFAGPVSVPPLLPPLLANPTPDSCHTWSAEPLGAVLVSAAMKASTQLPPVAVGAEQALGVVVPSRSAGSRLAAAAPIGPVDSAVALL